MYVFPLIAFALVVAALAFFLKLKREVGSTALAEARTAQEFLGIEDIRDGIVLLAAERGVKRRDWRLVMEVGAVNFQLLSDKEQNAIEDVFAGFVASLSFPVQFFVQTRLLDMRERVEDLRERAEELDGAMRSYAAGLAAYLEELMARRSIMTKRTYVVLPAQAESFEEASRELLRRAELVASWLKRCGLSCRVLGSLEVADMIYVLMNKERAPYAGLEQAEAAGFLALYATKKRKEKEVQGLEALPEEEREGSAADVYRAAG